MGGKALKKWEICGIRRVRKCTSDIFLARFPLDPNRCRFWIKATGNEDLAYLPLFKLNANKFICGDHFPLNMFNENKSRLKKFAVPTLNLLQPPLSDHILANFPIHDSHPEKKGILLDTLASTSKAGAHSDMLQVEESANNFKKRECPASTSKAETHNDIPHKEEPSHDVKKRKCLASTSKPGRDMRQVEEQANNLKERKIELSPRKIKLMKQLKKTKATLA